MFTGQPNSYKEQIINHGLPFHICIGVFKHIIVDSD